MDSFFGFDTSLLAVSNDEDDDAGDGKRSSSSRYFKEDESDDEEYDALNDETFGAADKGDWEHIHENLVRLESGVKEDDAASHEQDDYHNRTLQLDDYDLDFKFNFYDTNDESGRSSVGSQSIGDEFASKLRLDPSIWGSPLKVMAKQHYQPPSGFPPSNAIQQAVSSTSNSVKHEFSELGIGRGPLGPTAPMEMLSVEDIERNIIQQQQLKLVQNQQKLLHQQHQQQLQQQQQTLFAQQQQAAQRVQRKQTHPNKSRETLATPKDSFAKTQTIGMLAPSNNPFGQVVSPMFSTQQLLAGRNTLFPSVPSSNHSTHLLSHTAGRLPLGVLPPYNLLAGAPFTSPVNHFAMHPVFPHTALASHGLHGLLPGPITNFGQQRHPVPPAPFLFPTSASTLQNNQFNQRLVQEIQQNHPLLAYNRQLYQLPAGPFTGNHTGSSIYQIQKKPIYHQHHHQQQQHLLYRNSNGIPKPSPPVKHDEYANLMSNREKQWLIGIQLMQLNSDWPYFSDYYFTVFKERMAVARGESHVSRTYMDNQLNHPFTQPKGHAQLLLMSSMAKNAGMLPGVSSRERKSSESSKSVGGPNGDGKESGRTYAPLQFENSLGKLQCGSVTAPRKIIDMDVMGGDERDVNDNGVNFEHSINQRKTRHILLLIETLYRIVLKMEDLLNPTAVEAITMLREKREREREMNGEGTGGESRGSVARLPEHTESFDDLAVALICNLSQDKITSILGVRKGKILMRRVTEVLRNRPFRWTLWAMVFICIPRLQRKDRDDADGLLFSLYAEFERHVQSAMASDLLQLSQIFSPALAIADRAVMQSLTTCKLLLSAFITIIFQMEVLYGKNPRTIDTEKDELCWVTFLQHTNLMIRKSTTAQSIDAKPVHSSIRISADSNIARALLLHFKRFGARIDGTDLINFITDNGNSDSNSLEHENCTK